MAPSDDRPQERPGYQFAHRYLRDLVLGRARSLADPAVRRGVCAAYAEALGSPLEIETVDVRDTSLALITFGPPRFPTDPLWAAMPLDEGSRPRYLLLETSEDTDGDTAEPLLCEWVLRPNGSISHVNFGKLADTGVAAFLDAVERELRRPPDEPVTPEDLYRPALVGFGHRIALPWGLMLDVLPPEAAHGRSGCVLTTVGPHHELIIPTDDDVLISSLSDDDVRLQATAGAAAAHWELTDGLVTFGWPQATTVRVVASPDRHPFVVYDATDSYAVLVGPIDVGRGWSPLDMTGGRRFTGQGELPSGVHYSDVDTASGWQRHYLTAVAPRELYVLDTVCTTADPTRWWSVSEQIVETLSRCG